MIPTVKGYTKDEEVIVKYDKQAALPLAKAFKALCHPARVWIVQELVKEDHRVSYFVENIGVEFATVSRHLAKLRRAKLVTCVKKGRENWYQFNRKDAKFLNEQFLLPAGESTPT